MLKKNESFSWDQATPSSEIEPGEIIFNESL